MKISYPCCLKSARCDDQGEWLVTYRVPSSHAVEVAKLTALTGHQLKNTTEVA